MGRTWRIGDVARRTGLSTRTLRHYDDLGLLVPSTRSSTDYRLYDEDDLLRLLQIQSLKGLGLSLQEIGDALSDPDLDAGAALRGQLAMLEERIATEQRLVERLQTLAASGHRSWESVLTTIALMNQVSHPDPIVRLRAALSDPPDAEVIWPALMAETEPAVQDVWVWSLSHQPDALAIATAHLDDPDPALRRLMVRLVDKAGDRQAVGLLVDRLADPDPDVVRLTVGVLGRWGEASSLPAVIALLGDDRIARDDLVEAVAGFGTAAVPALSRVMQSPTARVRGQAAEALGLIGDASAVGVLREALADEDHDVRIVSLMGLAELGPLGREAVASAVDDPDVGAIARRLLADPHA